MLLDAWLVSVVPPTERDHDSMNMLYLKYRRNIPKRSESRQNKAGQTPQKSRDFQKNIRLRNEMMISGVKAGRHLLLVACLVSVVVMRLGVHNSNKMSVSKNRRNIPKRSESHQNKPSQTAQNRGASKKCAMTKSEIERRRGTQESTFPADFVLVFACT